MAVAVEVGDQAEEVEDPGVTEEVEDREEVVDQEEDEMFMKVGGEEVVEERGVWRALPLRAALEEMSLMYAGDLLPASALRLEEALGTA